MLLFRPHRSIRALFGRNTITAPLSTRSPMDMDVAWKTIYEEFLRWRKEDIEGIAKRYTARDSSHPQLPAPLFDSSQWWACLIAEKLRNYDAMMSAHKTEAEAMPKLVDLLPDYRPPADSSAKEQEAEAALQGLRDYLRPDESDSDAPDHSADEEHLEPPAAPPHFQRPDVVACGEMPAGSQLEDFHDPPFLKKKKNPEDRYWHGFYMRSREAFEDITKTSEVFPTSHVSWQISSGDVLGTAERQSDFLKEC